MIGHGYMYTGFQSQIAYTAPAMGGLSVSAGIFQPSRFAGDQTKTPGLQAKIDYDWKGGAPGKVWGGLVHQKTDCSTGSTAAGCGGKAKEFTASGYELGAKASLGNFEALLYGFRGDGLGLSTIGAQFFAGSDGAGNRTKSKGYFAQGTYKAGATKFGINVGQNEDRDGFVTTGASPLNTIKNRAVTVGVYHSLNKYITLVGELNLEKVTNFADSNVDHKNRSLSFGGLIFF
jgi:hypothetical protein